VPLTTDLDLVLRDKVRVGMILFIAHHLKEIFGSGIGVIEGELSEHAAGLQGKLPHGPDRLEGVRLKTENDRTQDNDSSFLTLLDRFNHLLSGWIPLLVAALHSFLRT